MLSVIPVEFVLVWPTRLRFRASRLRPDLTSILSRHVRTRDDPVLKCPSTSQRELDLYCEEILRRGKSQLFPLLLSATWSLWTQLYSSSCNFNQKSFDRYLHLSRIGGAHVCMSWRAKPRVWSLLGTWVYQRGSSVTYVL